MLQAAQFLNCDLSFDYSRHRSLNYPPAQVCQWKESPAAPALAPATTIAPAAPAVPQPEPPREPSPPPPVPRNQFEVAALDVLEALNQRSERIREVVKARSKRGELVIECFRTNTNSIFV